MDYIDIENLNFNKTLPKSVVKAALKELKHPLVKTHNDSYLIREDLYLSFKRVNSTDFSSEHWHYDNEQDIQDTLNWCALGGSFLADYAHDAKEARIFAWGMNYVPEVIKHTLLDLKGRDPKKHVASAVTTADKIINFVDTKHLEITKEQIVALMSLGPNGIRLPANSKAPKHLVQQNKIQFILSGVNTNYMNFVDKYLNYTKQPLMAVTSANFSSRGLLKDIRGTHKNLNEIQKHMGKEGIPIIAGHIDLDVDHDLTIHDKYNHLHSNFENMSPEEFAKEINRVLPISTTITSPEIKDGKYVWEIVRHGAIHYKIIQEKMKNHNVEVTLNTESRLEISKY